MDLVLLNWGDETPPVPDGWVNQQPGTGDFTTSKIDQEELDGVLLNWGTVAAVAVPEPSAMALAIMLVGAAVLSRFRIS